jgi:tetratricopeptide (TPR) repeat protein
MGELKEAKKYFLLALQINETKYGKDHTDTAISYNNLGLLLQDMGELEEAKKYYLLALQIRETKYGKDHTDTAISYNNLGLLLQDMGELEEAKSIICSHCRSKKPGCYTGGTRYPARVSERIFGARPGYQD